MKKIALVAMLGVLAAPSMAVVVNFDDLLGDNLAVPANYMGIANMTNWTYYNFSQPPYNPSSGTCRVYNTNNGIINMGQAVVFNGAFFNGNGDRNGFLPIYFDMYLGGNLVATSGQAHLDGSGNGVFLNSGYNGQVDKIQVQGSYGFFIMDDFTYNVVPEPVSMVAFGAGLAALAARRRRK
ncbi:MAG: PEP-CTERM sorting domain-containing protein [Armatimonadetes bacterium]|nr:PEP-CTERM sorting domain-containing protein [Armatimonadota bacterium]